MGMINVKGMSCKHCQASVTEAISKIAGVASVDVNLEKGTATWQDTNPSAPASVDEIKKAVRAIGFEA